MRILTSMFVALAAAVAVFAPAPIADSEPISKVFLNGVPTPVYFNDGDSFRVLAGPLAGSKARLAMFNTLETHGPVHQWGDWSAKELYVNAKKGMLNARRGQWHCVSDDLSTDGYGRILWMCLDLAVDQIGRGLAHTLRIDKQPSRPELNRAQHAAIAGKRGMWAHGTPDFVITSTHSTSEGRSNPYNRLVSSWDGHSEPMRHTSNYGECENVCFDKPLLDIARVRRTIGMMRKDADTMARLGDVENEALAAGITAYLHHHVKPLDGVTDAPEIPVGNLSAAEYGEIVQKHFDAGHLGNLGADGGSCMVYTDFKRRYGNGKAACLKWH